jgi:hypothetical protein
MAMDQPTLRASLRVLQPGIAHAVLVQQEYAFQPNLVVPMGTLLIQAAAAVNDVQTLSMTNSPTSGAVLITFTQPVTLSQLTVSIPYNATAAAVQALINPLFGAGNVVVAGGTLPGTAMTFTGASAFAGMPIPLAIVGASTLAGAGSTPVASVAHTTQGLVQGSLTPYAGSGSRVGVSKWDLSTDGNGTIYQGLSASGIVGASNWGGTYRTAPVFIKGVFNAADLVGFDSTSLTAAVGFARQLAGPTINQGLIEIL